MLLLSFLESMLDVSISQVIVMKMAWQSSLRREPVDLMSPNPHYLGFVESLLEAQKARKSKPCHVYFGGD